MGSGCWLLVAVAPGKMVARLSSPLISYPVPILLHVLEMEQWWRRLLEEERRGVNVQRDERVVQEGRDRETVLLSSWSVHPCCFATGRVPLPSSSPT